MVGLDNLLLSVHRIFIFKSKRNVKLLTCMTADTVDVGRVPIASGKARKKTEAFSILEKSCNFC